MMHNNPQNIPSLNNNPNYLQELAHIAKQQPPLNNDDVDQLNIRLQNKKKFIIQLGDCAEDVENPQFLEQIKFIDQLPKVGDGDLDNIKIIRGAGQIVKPRSSATEKLPNNQETTNYFGDLINNINPDAISRTPDPLRLRLGYEYIINCHKQLQKFNKTAASKIYSSKEHLLIEYEKLFCLNNYNLNTHMPWVGYRSNYCGSKQIASLIGIKNPIGVKIGPNTEVADLDFAINSLNPENQEHKLYLIFRYGANEIEKKLPWHLEFLKAKNYNFCLMSDPMHGNTKTYIDGKKIRFIEDIKKEIELFHAILKEFSFDFSGINLEATHLDVDECALSTEKNKSNRLYLSKCDPRLSKSQAIDVINFVKNLII